MLHSPAVSCPDGFGRGEHAGIHDQAQLLHPREHVLALVRIGHVCCLARERIVNFPVGQSTSFSSAGSIKPAASSSATASSLCLHHMRLPTTRVSQNAWPGIHSASLGGTSVADGRTECGVADEPHAGEPVSARLTSSLRASVNFMESKESEAA